MASLYEGFGELKTLKEWSFDERCKCEHKLIISRTSKGWSLEKAISEPKYELKDRSSVGKYFGEIFHNIKILSRHNEEKGAKRISVNCECLLCGKIFVSNFHVVREGKVKSCSCIKKNTGPKSFMWSGCGEIGKSYFSSVENGAKLRNLEFLITIEDIWNLFLEQGRMCAISGIHLNLPKKSRDINANASLDRKDSFKGYTKDNIQWVDKSINYAKQQMSDKDFIDLCRIVYEFNFKKDE